MWIGVFWGLAATFLWGSSYLIPLLAPEYNPIYITLSRGFFMGLCALFVVLFSLKRYRALSPADWWYAARISVVGNFLQGGFLFTSVLYAGVPVAGMCFGAVPVCVALISNWRDKKRGKPYVAMKKLALPLSLIILGFFACNVTEFQTLISMGNISAEEFFFGLACGLISTAMWTWYPIRNADWLQDHPDKSPALWQGAQSLTLLPIAAVAYVVYRIFDSDNAPFFGNEPEQLLFAGIYGGIICSYIAGIFWNICSKRCPTALVGQMLVFETIFSVIFGHIYRWQFPTPILCIGFVMLLAGIMYSLKLFDDATARHGETKEFQK